LIMILKTADAVFNDLRRLSGDQFGDITYKMLGLKLVIFAPNKTNKLLDALIEYCQKIIKTKQKGDELDQTTLKDIKRIIDKHMKGNETNLKNPITEIENILISKIRKTSSMIFLISDETPFSGPNDEDENEGEDEDSLFQL